MKHAIQRLSTSLTLFIGVAIISLLATRSVDAAPSPLPSATMDFQRSNLVGKVQVVSGSWRWSTDEAVPKLVSDPLDIRTAGANSIPVRFHCQGSDKYKDVTTGDDPWSTQTDSASSKGTAAISAKELTELGCRTGTDLLASFPTYNPDAPESDRYYELAKRMPPLSIQNSSSRVPVTLVTKTSRPITLLNWAELTIQGQAFYANTKIPARGIDICYSLAKRYDEIVPGIGCSLATVNAATGVYLVAVDYGKVRAGQKLGKKVFLSAYDDASNTQLPLSVFQPSISPPSGITLSYGGSNNTYNLSVPAPKFNKNFTIALIHDGGTDSQGNKAAVLAKGFESWLKTVGPFNEMKNRLKIITIQSSQSVMQCNVPDVPPEFSGLPSIRCDSRAIAQIGIAKQADVTLAISSQAHGRANASDIGRVSTSNKYGVWLHEILHLEPFGFGDEYIFKQDNTSDLQSIKSICSEGSSYHAPNVAYIDNEQGAYSSDQEARNRHRHQIPWYHYIRPERPITENTHLGSEGPLDKTDLGLYRNGPCSYTPKTGEYTRKTFLATDFPTIMSNASRSFLTQFHIDLITNAVNK